MSRRRPRIGSRPCFRCWLAGGGCRASWAGDAAPATVIPMLLDYYRQGRLPFDRLLRFYAFEDIGAAFHDMEQGEVIKPVLRMLA